MKFKKQVFANPTIGNWKEGSKEDIQTRKLQEVIVDECRKHKDEGHCKFIDPMLMIEIFLNDGGGCNSLEQTAEKERRDIDESEVREYVRWLFYYHNGGAIIDMDENGRYIVRERDCENPDPYGEGPEYVDDLDKYIDKNWY